MGFYYIVQVDFEFLFKNHIYLFIGGSMCAMAGCGIRGQLAGVVSPMWVPGKELGFSVLAVSAFTH